MRYTIGRFLHYNFKTGVSMNEVDLEGDGTGYSGTFRWKPTKVLGSMPGSVNKRSKLDYTTWMNYFISRCASIESAKSLVQTIQNDLSYVDCLSFPLSICYLFENSVFGNDKHSKLNYKKITLLCIGCSSKAEERVLRETNCFLELCYYFHNIQSIELWVIGPEMSSTIIALQTHTNIVKNQTLTCSIFKGTSIDFFRSNPSYLNKHTVVVGLNCGYGNFENPTVSRFDLLLSWLPDLYFLTGTTLPLLFTCANDYADLRGETTVMHKVMGANFILTPRENPFSFASTMVPPVTQQKGTDEYARGNSFCYGVQGCDKERRHKIAYQLGRHCIPEFKSLFNAQSARSIEQLVVSCSLQLEVIQSNKIQGEVFAAAKSSVSDTAEQALNALRVLSPSAESVVRSSSIGNETTRSVNNLSEMLENTGTQLGGEVNDHAVKELHQPAVVAEVVSSPLTTTLLSTTQSKPPPLTTPPSPQLKTHPLVPLTSIPLPFQCNQEVSQLRTLLTVTIVFLPPTITMAEIDLHISDGGDVLMLRLPAVRLSDGGHAETIGGVKGISTESHKIELICRVNRDSLTAKFSKKKNTLTLTTPILN